jgi:hypothetical protein
MLNTQIKVNFFCYSWHFYNSDGYLFFNNHHLIKSWSGSLLSLVKEFIGRGFSSVMWLTNVFALGPIRFLAGGVGKVGSAELEDCFNVLLGLLLHDVAFHLKMLWITIKDFITSTVIFPKYFPCLTYLPTKTF